MTFDGYVTVSANQPADLQFNSSYMIGASIRSPDRAHDIERASHLGVPYAPDSALYGENFFRGWMYAVYAWNYNPEDFSSVGVFVSSGCNACTYSFCSETLECFGDCNWNEFLNGSNQCERCPEWCSQTC
jgi:hypothetical protein